MSARLDTAAIRARRLKLGLSDRRLVALTGLGQAVIRGIEAGIAGDLTLRDLNRVADALSQDTLDLLTTDTPPAPPIAGPANVGRAPEPLRRHGRRAPLRHRPTHPVESLALTIGLSLDETARVIDELDWRARTIGLLVHRLGNSVKLWRPQDVLPHDFLRRIWRAHLARRGLDLGQARLLHQARHGRRAKALTNDQQVTVAEFVNTGLLVRTSSGGTDLSDDVRYSLLLSE